MNLEKNNLHKLFRQVIPDIYLENEEQYNQKIDEWFDKEENYKKSDRYYYKRANPREVASASLPNLSNYQISAKEYTALNKGRNFDQCTLQILKSKTTYLGNNTLSLSINRNAHTCFNLILKELGLDETNNPFCNKKGYFLDARIPIISMNGTLIYNASEKDIYQKIAYLDELIDIWIKCKSHTKLDENNVNKKISFDQCIRTENLLLSFLPVFDKEGNFKEFIQYKKDVELIKNKIESYKKTNLKDELTKKNFELLLSILPSKINDSVKDTLKTISDETLKITFMGLVVNLVLEDIVDVDIYLDEFLDFCRSGDNESYSYGEYRSFFAQIVSNHGKVK